MNLFRIVGNLIAKSSPLDSLISKAQKEFNAYLKDARQELNRSNINALSKEASNDRVSSLASDKAKRYLDSRRMAIEYSIGGSGGVTAPELFQTEFTADHFVNGSSARAGLLSNIDHLINQFEHGRGVSAAAATSIYGRFYKVDPRCAEQRMKIYLEALQGEKSTTALRDADIQTALNVTFPQDAKARDIILRDTYFLRSESAALSENSNGPTQHIEWLHNAHHALQGNREGLVGRKIGVVCGALQGEATVPKAQLPKHPGSALG